MRTPTRAFGIVTIAVALSACGAAHASNTPTATARATSTSGTTTIAGKAAPGAQTAGAPSPSALMICSPEIRHALATLLALPAPPPTSTTWVHNVYTCTYHLAQGPLVLTVREAGSVPRANSYFVALRKQLAPTHSLRGAEGLGLPAYEATGGNVVFVKDDKTLQVDSTRLPRHVERSHRTRSDLAYTLATDIMGCWSGD